MSKRGGSRGQRYMGGRFRSRGSTPGPHEATVVGFCHPKDPVDSSIQHPEA